MRKVFLFLCFLSFGVSSIYSQNLSGMVRYMKFQLFSSFDEPMERKRVYIVYEDSIIASSMTFKDGVVVLRIRNDFEENQTYFVTRQDDNCVSRIRLSCFHNINTVSVNMIKVDLIEDKVLHVDDIDIVTTQNSVYDVKNITTIPRDDSDRNNFLTQHYYPLECLMYSCEIYKQFMSDSIWLNKYKNEIGRYPNEKEMDSLVKIFQMEDSYTFERWCSFNISQLNEPVIAGGNMQRVYRFSWFVSNHFHRLYEPYSFRIIPSDNGAMVYFSYRYWDMCEEFPLYNDAFFMNQETYNEFIELLQKMKFWTSPCLPDRIYYDMAYTNVMEANIDGKYHVIFRGEGEDEGMEELREFLWGLTGLGENKIVHKRQRIE